MILKKTNTKTTYVIKDKKIANYRNIGIKTTLWLVFLYLVV
ncbi:hypothetical protein ['Camptotheca acuminata' phytoplasma]